MSDELKKKYEEIAKFIFSYCKKLYCVPRKKVLGMCCSEIACNITEQEAKRRNGVVLVRTGISFMKRGRCSVSPHLRAICSVHACDRLQLFAGQEFMDKYMKLREEISVLEYHEEEDRKKTEQERQSEVFSMTSVRKEPPKKFEPDDPRRGGGTHLL